MNKNARKRLRKIIKLLSKPLKVRAGVHPTKIFKDKSKYTRKKKHKKRNNYD